MATIYAGVVKQNIDATVLKRNLGKDPLNCLLVPDIGGDRPPRSSDLIGNPGRSFPVGVENLRRARPPQRRQERLLGRYRRLRPLLRRFGLPVESLGAEVPSAFPWLNCLGVLPLLSNCPCGCAVLPTVISIPRRSNSQISSLWTSNLNEALNRLSASQLAHIHGSHDVVVTQSPRSFQTVLRFPDNDGPPRYPRTEKSSR